MRITAGGQISVPAAVRRRWATRRVKVTDEGDRLIIEPEPENRFTALRGRFSGLSLTGDELAERSREDEEFAEERRRESR